MAESIVTAGRGKETPSPSEWLVMEVLVARLRLGETNWPFLNCHKQTILKLEKRGWVGWKSHIVEGALMVWLTGDGRKAWGVSESDVIVERLCQDVDDANGASPDARAADAELEQLRSSRPFVERLVAGQLSARLAEVEAERDAERAEVERLRVRSRFLGEHGAIAHAKWKAQCAEVERLRVENRLLGEQSAIANAQWKAECALADQLAEALRAVRHDRPTAHTDNVWTAINQALEIFEEARHER